MEHPAGDLDDALRTKQLRGAVLAVSVLDDVDVTPLAAGVRLDGRRPVLVPWSVVAEAVGDHADTGVVARRRLSVLLRLHRLVAEAGTSAPLVLRAAARMLALPADHAAHPGSPWVGTVQLGLAVTCGVGVLGLTGDPDEVVPLPPSVAEAAGVDPRDWWATLGQHADDMGALAVRRLDRDHAHRPASAHPAATASQAVIRPVGGVDALTLLTTSAVRQHLAASDGTGMRAVAVPMRTRAWYDLARVDPAYVAAAWSATDAWDRGLSRPVLVTADEVSMAPTGGHVIAQSLADPATGSTFDRPVRYR